MSNEKSVWGGVEGGGGWRGEALGTSLYRYKNYTCTCIPTHKYTGSRVYTRKHKQTPTQYWALIHINIAQACSRNSAEERERDLPRFLWWNIPAQTQVVHVISLCWWAELIILTNEAWHSLPLRPKGGEGDGIKGRLFNDLITWFQNLPVHVLGTSPCDDTPRLFSDKNNWHRLLVLPFPTPRKSQQASTCWFAGWPTVGISLSQYWTAHFQIDSK